MRASGDYAGIFNNFVGILWNSKDLQNWNGLWYFGNLYGKFGNPVNSENLEILRNIWNCVNLTDPMIWEGVWPYLNPMDSVCLRTASVEWNVPGKYGPHGELFFFLIEKEPATVPGSETFSPFFLADIRAYYEIVSRFKSAFVFVYGFRRTEGGACFFLKEFEAENFQ